MFTNSVLLCVLSASAWMGAMAFDIEPVRELNMDYYDGKWFQMYASLLPNITFERGMYCLTADYTASEAAGEYVITNGGNKEAPDGEWHEMELGMLTQNGTSGALQILANPQCEICPEMIWDYWVVGISPVVDAQYQWAIVSSADQEMLFILARDPEIFDTMYKETVLAGAAEMGFDQMYNSPMETYQGADCAYDEAPPGNMAVLFKSINMKKLETLLEKLKV